jgi:uncharacterized protein
MTGLKQEILCPFCKKFPAAKGEKFFPFCSDRCKKLDLGAWASEKYRVAAVEPSEEEGSGVLGNGVREDEND